MHFLRIPKLLTINCLILRVQNPVNPERRYRFDQPVTAVEFSKETPQLLAVGFFNGMIQVLDISDSDTDCIVAKSQRNASSGFEPIWDMKWLFGKLFECKFVT